MFEKGIQGWITQAVKHYAKANNKYAKTTVMKKEHIFSIWRQTTFIGGQWPKNVNIWVEVGKICWFNPYKK